ncbi:MAG: hypothetical protein A2270_05565 [Elusimicrobia bacterium RIFOXYA12_FULL_51_18]|nr:MAG: hypothetical protein A2270_05565 [Elusimicrobia bacterium RIFOXYA12_FULL_51_18]OGS28709.1 MAG: hypothetical protein A2218_11100 [Elusimicrobia bacterium RIFOXYA2_FULL_53_38]
MAVVLSCRPFNPAGFFVGKGYSPFKRKNAIKNPGDCAGWNAYLKVQLWEHVVRPPRKDRLLDGVRCKDTANPEKAENRPNGKHLISKIKTVKRKPL